MSVAFRVNKVALNTVGGEVGFEWQNLFGPLEIIESSGFYDFDICSPIQAAKGCKCQNQSTSDDA